VNETLTFLPRTESGPGDIAASEADPEAQAAPYGPDTSVVASYVAAPAGVGCVPNARVDKAALSVVSYHRDSTAARAWRDAYEEDAREVVVDPLDPDFNRDGSAPTLFGTSPTVAQVVVVDEDESAALFDVGETMLIVSGPFRKEQLQTVVNAVGPQG